MDRSHSQQIVLPGVFVQLQYIDMPINQERKDVRKSSTASTLHYATVNYDRLGLYDIVENPGGETSNSYVHPTNRVGMRQRKLIVTGAPPRVDDTAVGI